MPYPKLTSARSSDRLVLGISRVFSSDFAATMSAHELVPGKGSRLAGQHEKGSLKGILGIVSIPEDAPADSQNHRTVPPDQRSKGIFVALCQESFQQSPVRQTTTVLDECNAVEMAENSIHSDSLQSSLANAFPL
jgi:hypothetical protein